MRLDGCVNVSDERAHLLEQRGAALHHSAERCLNRGEEAVLIRTPRIQRGVEPGDAACRALSTGNAAACVSAVVGYFYFGYWFSRLRA